ncbi:MAG: hypothetical protein K9M07_04160 [Simkaniaceae bacterium]|nr:hypothetical protein [Simkaniaceae bacterium]
MLKDDIPQKANRLLMFILVIFILIGIRVVILTTLQYPYYSELSKKPQYKSLIEPANRGSIVDRDNHLLAANRIQYNAAVQFDEIRTIPKIVWKKRPWRKREKIQYRKLYIERLASILGEKLHINPLYIEDMIYSNAAIFPSTPFIIKEGIDEATYYELRMLERKMPGLKAQMQAKRTYPNGKTACHVLGYMGAINGSEHFKILQEIEKLSTFLQKREEGLPEILPPNHNTVESARRRLAELKEKSYSITTSIGKAGIEKCFDTELRGYYGRKKYEVNTHGHLIRELPDSYHATPGKRFYLNLSTEMQTLAEELLAQHEIKRDQRFRIAGKNHNLIHAPWIKGGAIIAIDPKTGAILALASYPRFDPNDFIFSGSHEEKKAKQVNIAKWLETPQYIGKIWDGKCPLERELFSPLKGGYYTQTQQLDWETYLDYILSKNSQVKAALKNVSSIKVSLQIQKLCQTLIDLCDDAPFNIIIDLLYSGEKSRLSRQSTDIITLQYTQDCFLKNAEQISHIKLALDPYLLGLDYNDDKLLFLDLCRLVSPLERFSSALIEVMQDFSFSEYRRLNQAFAQIEDHLKPLIRDLYKQEDFLQWRQTHFKSYLKEMRQREKENKTYQKPYLEYLTQKEKELFTAFYDKNRWQFIAAFLSIPLPHEPTIDLYCKACTQLSFKLIQAESDFQVLRHTLKRFASDEALALLQSFATFDDLNAPLWGYYHLRHISLQNETQRELAMHFYPLSGFGYARSYAFQESAPLGSIFKIITALESLDQIYSPDRPDKLNPMTIIDNSDPKMKERAKQILGYHVDGRKITRHYRGGRLPASYKKVGKIDLQGAFEYSSNIYFSLLASDILKKPTDLTRLSRQMSLGEKTGLDLPGEVRGILPTDIVDNLTGLYALAIGQHSMVVTPIQTAVMMSTVSNGGRVLKPEMIHKIESEQHFHERNLTRQYFPYKDYLNSVGIDFPLFTETVEREKKILSHPICPSIIRQLNYPKEVKHYLFDALYRVLNGAHGSARPGAIHGLLESHIEKKQYSQTIKSMIGKTATAEILYKPCLDRAFKPIICKHIWTSAVSFRPDPATQKPNYDEPELVVIVYLKFGDFGKEAAPLAVKMIQKYRELSKDL